MREETTTDVQDTHQQDTMGFATRPPRKINNRLLVIESIYHQAVGEQPVLQESRYVRALQSDEQPYVRRTVARKSWYKLDLGWLEGQDIGLIVVSNEEGKRFQTNPTPEELQELETKTVYLGTSHTPWAKIPAGESIRFTPCDPQSLALMIRADSDKVRIQINVYPA